MAKEVEPLRDDEAMIVPVDFEAGLALVAGMNPRLIGTVEPVPRTLIDRFAQVAGYAGGGTAARRLADGSLVRLAPETIRQLDEGARFARSGGRALGVLKDPAGRKFAGTVRFLPGAANPVAASML